MTEEEARQILAHAYPAAKFIAYAHTDQFMALEAKIGKGFHYFTLYEERIDSNHIENDTGVIIVSNTYLPSFAYNLTLAWLYESRKGRVQAGETSALLKYNFKKFWGEQLYHQGNNVFSRAILLETLLYEQQLMIPVFQEIAENEDWKNKAQLVELAMSNIVLFHELGHYYLQYLPQTVDEVFTEYAYATRPLLKSFEKNGLVSVIDEVKCDMMSILSLLLSREGATVTELLQSAIIGYSMLAILYSLQGSAVKTSDDLKKKPDDINLRSIATSTEEYSYIIGIGPDVKSQIMLLRAGAMIRFCLSIAQSHGVNLYADKQFLDIDHNLLTNLLGYVEIIMDHEDVNQRRMARLVAEAFHSYPEGMEYLYLKSKVFKSPRPLAL